MTPEQERRIQELPDLIAGEPNTMKLARLVAELERLWALKLNEMTAPRTPRSFSPGLPFPEQHLQ